MNKKFRLLQKAMEEHGKEDVCVAFSGGVDSSLLLKLACDAAGKHGTQVYAVTFQTRLHPSCDAEVAARVARELEALHFVIEVDELEQEEIRNNPVNRCYLCKKHLFSSLREFAGERGISVIMDGTNEDDLHVYRPGIKALRELGIISPLAACHVTKGEVKEFAASCGLSVASRPSAPCMATRLPYNTPIDYELLERIEQGENYLKTIVGEEGNVRLRLHGDIARLETDQQFFPTVLENRSAIARKLKSLGFTYITLDLDGFCSGSMDIHRNGHVF